MGNMNCQVCGKGYDSADVEMYTQTKDVQLSILDVNNPGMRKLLGMKTLMKCSNCGKISCADCAKEGGGPAGLACPACGVPYGVNSFVPPTAQAVNVAQPAECAVLFLRSDPEIERYGQAGGADQKANDRQP